jgi:hypothetical protein
MATVKAVGRSGIYFSPDVRVICPGCREEFYYIPHGLDSRVRGHWSSPDLSARISAGKAGSMGPQIAEFSAKHKDCPDPKEEEILLSGIRFRDLRRHRNV